MSSTSQTGSAAPASTAETVSVSARAASTDTEERLAKRQRKESETEAQAQLDDLQSQNRRAELELQIQQELVYQESLKLQQKQVAAKRAAAQQALRMPTVWSSAQQPAQVVAALTVQTCHPQGVQPIIAAGPLPPMQVTLPCSEAPVKGIIASGKPAKPEAALCNPVLFTSKTIAGRYGEWADNGVHGGSIKSQLKPTKRGLGLPKIGHKARAGDNLRNNRNLPEAIDGLIERGLSREAAIALVEKVVSDFGGLKSIAQQINTFHEMAHKSAEQAETTALGRTGKTVMEFELAYEQEVAMTLSENAV